MSGWGSFGYGEQEAHQRSGLQGTKYFDSASQNTFNSGVRMDQFVDSMMRKPQAMLNFGQKMLPGGKYGLGSNADLAVGQYGTDMFSKASASGAMRGQNNPENMSAVVGSAITNSLPFLIPQIMDFQRSQFEAPKSLFSLAKQAGDYWTGTLGQKADSNAFNFNIAGGGPGTGSSGKSS